MMAANICGVYTVRIAQTVARAVDASSTRLLLLRPLFLF